MKFSEFIESLEKEKGRQMTYEEIIEELSEMQVAYGMSIPFKIKKKEGEENER